MRDYKFRGKRVDNGEWVHGNSLNLGDRHFIIPTITNGSWSKDRLSLKFLSPCYEADPATVGQYTGLHDKNGREIWEGDLVKDEHGRVLEVFWNELGAGGWWFAENKEGEKWHVERVNLDRLEVIGNIWEHPDLLVKEVLHAVPQVLG
jgi:uncharacterized phage protein (TIGR01671 family)